MTDRRRFLLAGVAGAAGVLHAAGCTDEDDAPATGTSSSSTIAPDATAPDATAPEVTTPADPSADTSVGAGDDVTMPLTPADFEGLATCALLPEATAGPFPLDEQFDRRDITEGVDGHPLRIGLRVVDGACAAVAGASVEIWHADATGDYSAFTDNGGGKDEGTGTTFLRGTQLSTDDGIVEFLSIFPGWYSGRAVHIHLRVRTGDGPPLVSQLYFDDGVTDALLATGAYEPFGPPDTTVADDRIAGDPAADGTLMTLRAAPTARGEGSLALLNVGVSV